MSPSALIIASLLVLGMLFTFNISPTLAQPCENNGHGILGEGKQIFKQSNHCIIIENNNVPTSGICGTNSVLQNGVCVPTTSNGVCGTNSVLQNGVCVPTTSNGVCGTNSVLQNGVCVPTTNPTQSAPVANAGPNQSVNGGTSVRLDGSGSFATTSGATIVSYSWSQTTEPFVTLFNPNSTNPTFTAPPSANPYNLTFSLTVTDSNGLVSTPSSVTITVTPSS